MSSPHYFQGNSLYGPVRASAAQTFRDVVDAFRICANIGMTREAFLALPDKERNEKKQVPFFVPCVFRTSPSERIYANATHCNLIFMDIDPEKEHRDGKYVETGRYPAMPFVRDPQTIRTALHGFNFAAYHTASSTPDKPRIRIVVECERIPLSAYPRAVNAVATLLGLPVVTKESKVAVQPMFMPVMFSDSSDEDHPLFIHEWDDRPLRMSDLGEEDEDFLPTEIKTNSVDPSLDTLAFLRAPVPEITLGMAKEALYALDADCSRAEWLNCAAALKHQFGHNHEDKAFEIFDDWSSEGKKYGGEEETKALWKSLRPTPIGRVPTTIRSLLHYAEQNGWDSNKVKDSGFLSAVRWMEETATSAMELLGKGPGKILSVPLLNPMQEDALANMLCRQARVRFAYTVSPTVVKKAIKRLKEEIKAQESLPEKTQEPNWTRGVLYVAAAKDFYRQRTGEKYKAEAFNAIYSRKLLPTAEQLKGTDTPITPATLSKPIVLPADYALNHIKIATVYEYDYDPSQPTETIFVRGGKKYVNTYCPACPEFDHAGMQAAGELFLRHMGNLIAEENYRKTIIDFMAYMVQSPGRKIRWAILIQSVEGGGKTYLAEVMKAVLGEQHVRTITGDAIKKGWNEWSFGRQLIVLEEIRVAGTTRYEIMNALKTLITNDGISINQRNCDTREVRNISNYMIFSNHHNALALTPGDRRYFVVKSPLQSRDQVLALGEHYFEPLYEMLRDKPGALRAFLDQWEISPGFNPDAVAPRTHYTEELINDSASDLTAAIRRLMLEGDYPLVQYDIVSSKKLIDVIQMEEGLTRITPQEVGHVLREEGLHHVGRFMIDGERHQIWARHGLNGTSGDIAIQRCKANVKNLHMELLY